MFRGSLRKPILALLALSLSLSSALEAKEARPKEPRIKDLTDTVLTNRITTKFALLLRWSGQGYLLSSRGPFTLFVPTDSAFSRFSPEIFTELEAPENREVLQRIILFHVVNGKRLSAKDMQPLKTLLSCEGNPLPLRINHSGYQIVGKAKVLHADIRCANGLLDEIDTLLLPPGVSLAKLTPAAPPGGPEPTTAAETNGASSTPPQGTATGSSAPPVAPSVGSTPPSESSTQSANAASPPSTETNVPSGTPAAPAGTDTTPVAPVAPPATNGA